MLSAVALLVALCCFSQPALTRTVKQKRDLGDMETEYFSDDGELSGYFDQYNDDGDLLMYFYVTYDRTFNDDWLEAGSAAFLEEAGRVETSMKALFSPALNVDESDMMLEVIGFLPGSTKAEIALKIPAYYSLTETDVATYVEDIPNYGTIDGAEILKLEELMNDIPLDMEKREAIILELTYAYDISDESIDLSDSESEEFKAEAGSLRDQLILLLVDKLAAQGTIVNPDQIELNVLAFASEGSYTRAEISVLGEGINVEQLSYALQYLVVDNDIRINNRPIISLDEISRELLYFDDESMKEEVMETDDFFNGFGPAPLEDIYTDVEGEVMHDKDDTLNGETFPEEDFLESAPPEENDPSALGIETPASRRDGAAVLENEPVPLDEETPPWYNTGESVPPDDDAEKTTRSVIVTCEDLYGEWSDCANDTRTKESVTFISGDDDNVTFCRKLTEVCIDCQLDWRVWSECDGEQITYRDQFVIVEKVGAGEECPEPRTESQPCQTCVIEWGDWGDCVEGSRERSQYIAQTPIGGAECPPLDSQNQVCIDCEMEWGNWSDCTNNVSVRRQVIVRNPVNGGIDCILDDAETEECHDCVAEWGDWSEYIDGERSRRQHVAQKAVGRGKTCSLDEEFSLQCQVAWSGWSACANGISERQQIVTRPAEGRGEACPELEKESTVCVDCAYTWEEWGECQFGLERRFLIVDVEPVGAGAACPEDQAESRSCCFMQWTEWTDCTDGMRSRFQNIIIEPEEIECPEPKVQSEDCVDCVLKWGPWGECENSRLSRTQFLEKSAKGGGKDCPEVQTEDEYCANCIVDWGPWGGCENGVRERQEYISEDLVGAGEECPELQSQTEGCIDCDWEWSDWSDCEIGERFRVVIISQDAIGVGAPCPNFVRDNQICVDCIVEWGDWSRCDNGVANRTQVIAVSPAGAGKECPELQTESDVCVDCVVEWREWSECSDGQRTKTQYIVTLQQGQGRECPNLKTVQEACVDCVVEWTAWSNCFGDIQRREQRIEVDAIGAGRQCSPLEVETIQCVSNDTKVEETICRFVDTVVGWNRAPTMRDLLLMGDESGSIGWVNFAKIKENFKSIARNIRGGVGTQETQLAMSSFARHSRVVFDFDDHYDIDDIDNAIDQVYFKGGYRSKIGASLIDANTWIFQQSSGMRSFPNLDDNIDHEILIVTDGCRTSDPYHLQQGLKTLKQRGIKLFVLAIASHDQRCRDAIDLMVDHPNNLFDLGSWKDLDEMTRVINERVCVKSNGEESEPREDGRK